MHCRRKIFYIISASQLFTCNTLNMIKVKSNTYKNLMYKTSLDINEESFCHPLNSTWQPHISYAFIIILFVIFYVFENLFFFWIFEFLLDFWRILWIFTGFLKIITSFYWIFLGIYKFFPDFYKITGFKLPNFSNILSEFLKSYEFLSYFPNILPDLKKKFFLPVFKITMNLYWVFSKSIIEFSFY